MDQGLPENPAPISEVSNSFQQWEQQRNKDTPAKPAPISEVSNSFQQWEQQRNTETPEKPAPISEVSNFFQQWEQQRSKEPPEKPAPISEVSNSFQQWGQQGNKETPGRAMHIPEVSDHFKQWEQQRHKEHVDYFTERLPTPEVPDFADVKSAVAALDDWGRTDFDEWVEHMHREGRSPLMETNRDRTLQGFDLAMHPMLDPSHKPDEREEHSSHLEVRNVASDILAQLEHITTDEGRERHQLEAVREACGLLHQDLRRGEEGEPCFGPGRHEASHRSASTLPRPAKLVELRENEASAEPPRQSPGFDMASLPPEKKEGHAGIRCAATEAKLLLELATAQDHGMLGMAARRSVEEQEQAEKAEREAKAAELRSQKESEAKAKEGARTKRGKGKKLTRLAHKAAITGKLAGDSPTSHEEDDSDSVSLCSEATSNSSTVSEANPHKGGPALIEYHVDYHAVLIHMSQVCRQSKEELGNIVAESDCIKGTVVELEAEVEDLHYQADTLWDRMRELEVGDMTQLRKARDPHQYPRPEPQEVRRKPYARTMGEAQAVVTTRSSLRTADLPDLPDLPENLRKTMGGRRGKADKRDPPLDVGLLTNLSADGLSSWARF